MNTDNRSMSQLSSNLQVEREAIIAEIHAAFKGVSRDGGVSWSEAAVIDQYGAEGQRRQARARDTDRTWTELEPSMNWARAAVVGHFPLLDPIGFRYYLPAAMMQTLESSSGGCSDTGLDIVLTLNHKAKKPSGVEIRDSQLRQWSLLDARQRRCVERFIRHIIAWEEAAMDEEFPGYEARHWRKTLESCWDSTNDS
jgi:hypothetical protein